MANSKNRGRLVSGQNPNLPKTLFWDWNYDQIDWEKSYLSVIARVIERGDKKELDEMVRFYGKDRVTQVLKFELTYLPDYVIDEVCGYFNLKKEELACYTFKQSRRGHWI